MLTHPFYQTVLGHIQHRKTFVCVGLDPDLQKIPPHFPSTISGLQAFLFEIIDATSDLCIAYKPNISFFEALGIDGLRLLEAVAQRIPSQVPIILDAKRGDIGNTSAMQARYIFDYFGASAVTLHPYMGTDSLTPFFDYSDKYHFVLALTSNPGAADFEKLPLADGRYLYEAVALHFQKLNQTYHNIGLVVGATQQEMARIRALDSEMLFLVPGVGAQGGDYAQVVEMGGNRDQVVIVNLSRSILYCADGRDYIRYVREALLAYCQG